jgi:hypothetical protein
MSQYPVADSAGIIEGVNYLLSGPSGSGQNFDGYKSYVPEYVTSYFRAPFVLPKFDEDGNVIVANQERTKWSSSPISISTITPIDEFNFQVNFASAQPTAPYSIGQGLFITGSTATGSAPGFYNAYWTPPGVVTCSTTAVVIRTNQPYTLPTGTGGVIRLDASDSYVSTAGNGRVKVFGPNDRVFVSGEINFDYDYTSNAAGSLDVYASINRYVGFIDTQDPVNNELRFLGPDTIVEKLHTITIPGSGTGTITNEEFFFTTLIDSPTYTVTQNGQPVIKGYGFYWYILELFFVSDNESGAIVLPTQVTTNYLSFTAQVIKQ